MRRTLLGAVMGMTVLITAPFAAPLASAAPKASTSFSYAVIVDGAPPVAGQSWTFDATLLSEDAPVSGVAVVLEKRPAGATAFVPAATAVTGSDGVVEVDVKLVRTTAIRWRFAGNDELEATTSAPYTQIVAPKVTARGSDLTLRRGQLFAATGWTFPAKPGQRVTLWLGHFSFGPSPYPPPRLLAIGVVRSDGTFRLPWRFYGSGTKRLFVKVARDGQNTDGYSNYLLVKVS